MLFRFGFSLEPCDAVRVLSKLFRQHSNCYVASELEVLRLINFSHASFAEPRSIPPQAITR